MSYVFNTITIDGFWLGLLLCTRSASAGKVIFSVKIHRNKLHYSLFSVKIHGK